MAGVVTAHVTQRFLSYRIGEDATAIRHGSYGFTLARYAPVDPGRRTVVLLGNSVYQFCEIVPRMQKLADERNLNLRLLNLSQTGAGIVDHVVQAGQVLRHSPDLLVVTLAPSSFDRALPPFRTDANLMAFDAGPLHNLPYGFYRAQFDHKGLADSAFAALVPFPRVDPVLRASTNLQLHASAWALRRLSFPTLNLAADWLGAAAQPRPEGFPSGKSYADSEEVIHQLTAMSREAGVPLLLIWQEYQSSEPDLLPVLLAESRNSHAVHLADLHGFWSAQGYSDQVHPSEGERDAYAARHFAQIVQALPPVNRATGRR